MFKKVSLFLLFLVVMFSGLSYGNELIERVFADTVCMVNNNVMGVPQIPVKVGDDTYYGCCMGCVGSIKDNKIDPSTGLSVRYAIDPISNHQVDKSKAVIGALPSGKALYFESEENFNKYSRGEK